MLNLTRFALDNARLTVLAIVAIVGLGITLYLDHPRQEDPSITVRDAKVVAFFPGMSPGRIEELVTRKLEEKIREIPEVENIKSESLTGKTVLTVSVFERYTDMAPIWQSLRNKMEDVKGDLPDGTRGPFINDQVGLTAVATIAVTGEGFSLAEIRDVTRQVRDRLYSLTGIKQAEIHGEREEQIFLHVSNSRLAEFGISPALIIETLQNQNIIRPGGNLRRGGLSFVVEPSGSYTSIDDIRHTLINVPGTDNNVVLQDIAEVTRGYAEPPEKLVYFNGAEALVIGVSIVDNVNAIAFGERLTRLLQQLEAELPIGYQLRYATYQPELIQVAVDDAVGNVYQTLAIVLTVVMLFLGWRTGLIVGAIVPLSMLLAVIVMNLIGIELQRISIAAMIIALGLLVDNGIVVAEDIKRRLQAGEARTQAALQAGRELSVPLLTSSLTTILAFMPMLLAESASGEYTRSLSQVIIIVLLGSWMLAMTVTPCLCAWLLDSTAADCADDKDTEVSQFQHRYRRCLIWVLGHRRVVLAVSLACFVASVWVFGGITRQFFPESDRNQFLVYIDLPAGSDVRQTEASVLRLSRWLSDADVNPEVTANVAYVGFGGPRFFLSLSPLDPDPQVAFVLVNVRDAAQVPQLAQRTRQHLLNNAPELRAHVKQMWLGPSEAGLVQLRVTGPDAQHIYEIAEELQTALRAIPGTVNIKQNWHNKIFKVKADVNQLRARRAGVTSEDIAMSLNAYLDGVAVTDYRERDLTVPVVLRGSPGERESLDRIADIEVYASQADNSVPLSQVAEVNGDWMFSRIIRRNQERVITVEAKHLTLQAEQLLERLTPSLESLQLLPGHRIEIGGEQEKSAESKQALFAFMPPCLLLILILLVWQFNSLRRAAVIVLTIPLSFIGAVIGLKLSGALFGFMAILGLFSLAGIIINNGIVLLDRIEQERAAGHEPYVAVITAAEKRLRPILMTTLTTVMGLLPLVAFGGPLWFAMAIVIIFGLVLGTLLTLVVVPVLYGSFFRVQPSELNSIGHPA